MRRLHLHLLGIGLGCSLALSTPLLGASDEPAATPPAEERIFGEPEQLPPEYGLRGSERYRAEIARRQTELADLKAQLAQRARELRAEFQLGKVVTSAVAERDAARRELQATTEQALKPLNGRAAYRSALERKTAAKARLANLKDAGAAPGTIAQAAQDAVDAANLVADMEAQALRAVPELPTLRKRVGQAESALARLPAQAEAFVQADAKYQALCQAIEDTLADIEAAKADLQYALDAEPDLANPFPDPDKPPAKLIGRNAMGTMYRWAYGDWSKGKWTYWGMKPMTMAGEAYVPDPHQHIRKPTPYGQVPR